MHVIITTRSGSRYEINDVDSSWKRLEIGNDEYTTRTPDGWFTYRSSLAVGQCLTLVGEGLISGVRLITTTPITDIQEV